MFQYFYPDQELGFVGLVNYQVVKWMLYLILVNWPCLDLFRFLRLFCGGHLDRLDGVGLHGSVCIYSAGLSYNNTTACIVKQTCLGEDDGLLDILSCHSWFNCWRVIWDRMRHPGSLDLMCHLGKVFKTLIPCLSVSDLTYKIRNVSYALPEVVLDRGDYWMTQRIFIKSVFILSFRCVVHDHFKS